MVDLNIWLCCCWDVVNRIMKSVKAVAPYIHPEFLNFKTAPFEAWERIGGKVAESRYPARLFHGLAFRFELPMVWKNRNEARLRFMEPVSLSFDTFPDYARYEIIPFVWDCWPCYFEKMCRWMEKHQVRTAIFTSSQTAELMRQRFPELNILHCPEAVDTSNYYEGKLLKERDIDLLEFGRESNLNVTENRRIRYVCTKVNGKFIYTNEQLYDAMGDAKITIALPRSITDPEITQGIETLTQRYWECMLSRMVMVGHVPKELTDLIGYNPVIELDREHPNEQIMDILAHIEDYQPLVDRNRETALRLGDWTLRMQQVMDRLRECGYEV